MRMFLKGAAVALALTGAAFAVAGTAGATGLYVGSPRHDRGAVISVGFGDVAFGYRDGYWDNGHQWHSWRHHRDYRSYRNQHGSNYHNWNHDRDSDNGWQRR